MDSIKITAALFLAFQSWPPAAVKAAETAAKNPAVSILPARDQAVSVNKLGIGTANPTEPLHLFSKNMFMESDDEGKLEITMKHNGLPNEPRFKMGRVVLAGDGDPEFRFVYSDLLTPERTVFEFDKKGIVASVKKDVGSHFEGFIWGDSEPLFRLNSYPKMQLEFGAGGKNKTDVAIRRETAGALVFINGDAHAEDGVERMRIDPRGQVGIGTQKPESALQVKGYIQLDLTAGAPPAADCNEPKEEGRMKFDSGKDLLFICSGSSGWAQFQGKSP